jgi:hypothetical protein
MVFKLAIIKMNCEETSAIIFRERSGQSVGFLL